MSAKRIKKRAKKEERTQVAGQWVEIEVVEGVTRSTFYPDNAEMEKVIERQEEKSGRKVELIYRRMNFVHGVPPEYFWTTRDPQKIKYGGMAIQRLRVEDWREHIKHEVGEHLTPSRYMQPRPASRGVCECEGCLALAARMKQAS